MPHSVQPLFLDIGSFMILASSRGKNYEAKKSTVVALVIITFGLCKHAFFNTTHAGLIEFIFSSSFKDSLFPCWRNSKNYEAEQFKRNRTTMASLFAFPYAEAMRKLCGNYEAGNMSLCP